ncbi:MAG TPA: hypothetical protein VF420_11855 [Casimicrobiaceae bacterium]
MSCGGGTPTTWAWTWTGGNNAATPTISGQISTTTTFKITASNAGGAAPQVQGTITIGGGGGGGGALDCTSSLQSHGWPNAGPTVTIDIPWPNDGSVHQYFTSQAGGLFGNGAVVLRFTTSAATTSSGKGSLVGVEYQSSPSERKGAFNTTPCDFDTTLPLFNCAGQTTGFDTNGPNLGLWQSTSTNRSCAVTLKPSTTYYFNLYNAPGATCTGQGSCDMLFNFQKPSGT